MNDIKARIVELEKAYASLQITLDNKDIDIDTDWKEKMEFQQKIRQKKLEAKNSLQISSSNLAKEINPTHTRESKTAEFQISG